MSWVEYALLGVIVGALSVMFGAAARSRARTRGEESGVPEPSLSCGCPKDSRPRYGCLWCSDERCGEHRDEHEHGGGALTEHEVRRRLAAIARRESDLRNMADRIGPLYLNGADR